MEKRRVLVSWIGFADLKALCLTLPKNKQEMVSGKIKLPEGNYEPNGPIRTLLSHHKFHNIYLLNNFGSDIGSLYQQFIGFNSVILDVDLHAPTDHESVFYAADKALTKIVEQHKLSTTELCIHLSPGTPTMAAIWVLLGKSKFPATFYQTYKGEVIPTKIPFDLTVDFLPLVMKNPDIAFQHLAEQTPEEIEGFEKIAGVSQQIRMAAGRAKRAAMRDVPLLLIGESGTGKELFAHAIHFAGARKNKPFKAVNCAAIPPQLLESELFGHKKGAFTGADKDRKGLFSEADGGTLFLDEIGECPLEVQTKLLRVLQPAGEKGLCNCAFTPLGSTREEFSNVRVIAATNRNLIDGIRQKCFREDLYYRLAVITINLPPLRERPEDIVPLAESYLDRLNQIFQNEGAAYRHKFLCDSTKTFIRNYSWPGNVRQLNNAILQASVMAEAEKIEKHDIQAALADNLLLEGKEESMISIPDRGIDLEQHLNTMRSKYLASAMKQAGGNKTRAAHLLGIKNYQTLDAQLKRLKVEWEI